MMRRFGWAVRRELWENRWMYLAPAMLAAVIVVAFLAHLLGQLPTSVATAAGAVTTHSGDPGLGAYDVVAGLMMLAGLLVAAIYSVDALYGERRDRSILLWKSLPVSDRETVLAKLAIPVLVVPVVVWALTFTVHVLMLLTSMAVLAARGGDAGLAASHFPLFESSLGLLYHLVCIHGLLTTPIYAWLLLVSAWAPRAPFAWAIVPPLAIGFVERVALGTSRFGALLLSRLGGGASDAPPPPAGASLMDAMTALPPSRLLLSPGLWVGFVIAALFVAGAMRARRAAQPV